MAQLLKPFWLKPLGAETIMERTVVMEAHGATRAGEDPAARSRSGRLSSALTGIFAA